LTPTGRRFFLDWIETLDEVVAGIEAYCRRHRVKKVTDLVGALEV